MTVNRFSCLLYREIYMVRKQLITGLITFGIMVTFGILLMLSLRFGNLYKLPDIIYPDMPEYAEEARQTFSAGINFFVKLFPAIMLANISFACGTVGQMDENAGFRHFMQSTPVTPFMRALVRVTFNAAAIALTFALAFLYMFVIGLIQGSGVQYNEAAILGSLLCVYTALCVVIQVLIIVFHDMNKAMISILAAAIVIVLILSNSLGSVGDESTDGMERLRLICENIFPFVPLIFAVTLGGALAAMTVLYKRRDK